MIIVGSRRVLLFPGGIVVLRELIRRLLLLLILRHVFSLIPASSSSSSRRAIGIVVRIVSLLVTITAVTVLRPGVVLLVVRIKRILSSSAGVGVHNFPKGFWMMNSDVIGGAFFSLSIPKSIVQKHKTPRRRRHSGSIETRCVTKSSLRSAKKKATAVKKATRVSKHGISIGKTKKKKKCGKRMTRPDF